MNEQTSKKIFHSGSLLAIIVAILFVIFLVLQMLGRILSGVDTTLAIRVTADDSFTGTGWFFRNEVVAQGVSSETVKHIVHSGEKVQKNAALAVVYTDTAALEASKEMSMLDDQIELLTSAMQSTTSGGDTSKLDKQIASQMSALSSKAQDGVVTGIQTETVDLRNLCLRRSASELDGAALSAQLSTLTTQRNSLEQQLSGRSTTIASPASGYFSDIVDGLEGELTQERLDALTVEDIKELEESYAETTENSEKQLGKIIQDFRWYFAMVVPVDELENVEVGDSLNLRFSQVEDDIPVTVYDIHKEKDADEAVLIVSGMEITPELVTMRRQEAELIFNTYTGIQVPKSAVKINTDADGNQQQGVYILAGNMSRFKPIDILYEADTYYVVKQGTSSEDTGLVAGDNIIVKARGLEDSKVIK